MLDYSAFIKQAHSSDDKAEYDPKLPIKAKYMVQNDGRWLAVIYQDTVLGKRLF